MSTSRVEFANRRGHRLVGEFSSANESASGGAVLVLAHGFASDRHSRGRFRRVAEAAARFRVSCLAFDFSGCGESADVVVDPDTQQDDMLAALAEVGRMGFRRVGVWGHSLGSLAVLRAARRAPLQAIVLTGGATAPMPYEWADYFSPAAMRTLAETSVVPVASTSGSERVVRIGQALLDDMTAFDAEELLSGVTCPVLMIHGNGDDEERELLARSRRALSQLPAGSRVELLEGATHGFPERFDEAIGIASPFLASLLSAPE